MNATSVDVCADCTCYRSLGATLMACLSTFGLAAAQNWGLEPCVSSLIDRICGQGLASVSTLLSSNVYNSVATALNAWRLRRAVVSTTPGWKSRSKSLRLLTSIMVKCPTYIELPPRRKIEDVEEDIKKLLCACASIDAEEVYKSYPLQIFPPMIENAQGGQPCQTVEALPQPARRQERTLSLASHNELVELSFEGKVALIAKGLVPTPEELSSVRLRSGLATLVVGLQASGYLLGNIERLVQHLAISPIEYIVTIVSLQVIIQTICQHFGSNFLDRPLLFHLNSNQFDSWIQNSLEQVKVDVQREQRIGYALNIVFSALCLELTIYYGIHFMMLHKCILCSVSALFFSVAILMDTITLLTATISEMLSQTKYIGFIFFLLASIMSTMSTILFVTSIIIALIATTKGWDEFRNSSSSLFWWIIPHVAT